MLTRIAFERHGDTIPGLPRGIYTINPDGSDCRQIRAGGMYPRWSPDGQWIAFREDTEDNEWLSSAFLMRPDGQQVRRVTFHRDISVAALSWSPDSKRLAYSLWFWQDRLNQIFTVDLQTGGFSQITHGADDNADPVWTPNNEIVFRKTTDPQQAGRLFVMDPDGKNQREHGLFGIGDRDPVWTYDGKKVGYYRDGQFFFMNSDGSGLQKILTRGSVTEMVIAPDGKRIAYSAQNSGSGAGFEVFVSSVEGTDLEKLVANPRWNNKEVQSQDISWSPILAPVQNSASEIGGLNAAQMAFDRNAEEMDLISSRFSSVDKATLGYLQGQYQQKLQIMESHVNHVKSRFPYNDDVRLMEAFFLVNCARLKLQWNASAEALDLMSRSISIFDLPSSRIVRASMYRELGQNGLAIDDLDQILANPPDDPHLYSDARQMKNELKKSFGPDGPNQTLPIISVGLGALGIVTVCCWGGFPFGIAAIIFGLVGMNNAINDPKRYGGRGLAIAGIAIGAVDLFITIIMVLIWIVRDFR